MGRFLCLAVVVAACGSDPAGGDDDDNPGAGEPAALSGITAAHNAVRAEVDVGPMTWNSDLAALATGFIADCEFAHSDGSERSNVAGFEYVGENLFASGGGGSPTGQQITDAWASEKSDYDYGSNSCSGTCGHYTQIVWAESVDLGCAVKDCGGMFIVSCEYGPGGNFVGQRPY